MIELLILFVIGFILGWKLNAVFHTAAMFTILKELGIKESDLRKLAQDKNLDLPVQAEHDELEEIHIKLEQHQGQIYAFRTDNDGFLAQGSDRDTLISSLQQRMNNVRLIVDEGGDLIKKPEEA